MEFAVEAATLEKGMPIGVRSRASIEFSLYCGVCTDTEYETPFAQSNHCVGATWPLELSEMSRLLETSRCVMPTCPAMSRSTFTEITGQSTTW